MLPTLGFNFLYHKLQLLFICHTTTPYLSHKGFLKFGDFETYFEFQKISSSITLNCECFLSVVCRSLSSKFVTINFLKTNPLP